MTLIASIGGGDRLTKTASETRVKAIYVVVLAKRECTLMKP